MTPAAFGRRRLSRRLSALCFPLACALLLRADSCDRTDPLTGTTGGGAVSAAGNYRLVSVVSGTDSATLPFTFSGNGSTFAFNGATLGLTTTGGTGAQSNGNFTLAVQATQNTGFATALGIPAAGTWSQNGSTITFSGVDGSAFTGTLAGGALRLTPVNVEARGSSALRFARL